jgi:hypothetical protein
MRRLIRTQRLSDLRPHSVEEIIEFFVDYNKRDCKFKPGYVVGPLKADEPA